MSKKLSVVILIIAIAAICLSAFSLVVSLNRPVDDNKDVQYVLFLGTNDKDTAEPVFTPEEAKETLKDILIKRFGGYTVQEANGGWKGDDGTEYREYTLVIYLSDTTADDVHALCDELIGVYNQSSVLIQQNETETEFYYGE